MNGIYLILVGYLVTNKSPALTKQDQIFNLLFLKRFTYC